MHFCVFSFVKLMFVLQDLIKNLNAKSSQHFFPLLYILLYIIKIIERNPTLSDSFPCEQAFGCWRLFPPRCLVAARRKKPPAEPGSGRVMSATTSRGVDGRREKGKKNRRM